MWVILFFTPGGCQKDGSSEQQDGVTEEQASVDGLATADVISEDPHAVLVEFSSVVADTQEYIIKVRALSEHALGNRLWQYDGIVVLFYYYLIFECSFYCVVELGDMA